MSSLSLYDFLSLLDQDQYEEIFQRGDYPDISIEGEKRFVLYAVYKLFVEVEYESSTNKIVNKRASTTGDLLDKYSGKLS